MKNMITQAMLTEYLNAFDKERKIRSARQAMRDQLLAMLCNGAAVEFGTASAKLVEYTSVTFSKAKLLQALGPKRFESLRSKVEPTVRKQLRVVKHKPTKPANVVHKFDENDNDDWL
jgi:hypothetical protein